MSKEANKGFDPQEIAEYKKRIGESGMNFIAHPDDEQSDEYRHFYFIGSHAGQEMIIDCVMYTLRLHYESELFETAEQKVMEHFPDYKKVSFDEDDDTPDPVRDEIGLYMAEIIMALEEEEAVRVKEHIEIDEETDFGVGLDVGLNLEEITPEVISQFIRDYNQGTLQLDETLYTFDTEDEAP